jgi:hypothetical protein
MESEMIFVFGPPLLVIGAWYLITGGMSREDRWLLKRQQAERKAVIRSMMAAERGPPRSTKAVLMMLAIFVAFLYIMIKVNG